MTDAVDLDQRPQLPDSAARHLLELLAAKSWTLNEWFTAAARFRIADDLVPALLDAAIYQHGFREQLLDLAGARGQQLAAQRTEWASLRRFHGDDRGLATTTAERLQWFREQRRIDPERTVHRLAASWPAESGRQRALFLKALDQGLGSYDVALLERALDDPRVDVQLAAVQMLRRLPTSPFAARMAARARAWLRIEAKPLRPRLVVNLPGSLDGSARRDGIEHVHFKNKGIQRWWLRMVVVATPLRVWEDMIGSAASAWEIPIEDTWRSVIQEGWTSATVLQRNPRWAGAMLLTRGRQTPRHVVPLAPIRQRVFEIRSGLTDHYLLDVDGQALFDGLPHPWPEPVVYKVVELLSATANRQAQSGRSLGPLSRHSHHTTLRRVEAHFPFPAVVLLDRVAERTGDPDWARAFRQAAAGIRRRRRLLEELH